MIPKTHLSQGTDYKKHTLSWEWGEPSSSINRQSDITSEVHFIILLRFVSTNFTITSINHLRDYSLYASEEINSISLGTPEGGWKFQQSHYILPRADCNPHLSNPYILSSYRRGCIRRTEVHQYSVVNLRRIVRTATLQRTRMSGELLLSDRTLSLGKDEDLE